MSSHYGYGQGRPGVPQGPGPNGYQPSSPRPPLVTVTAYATVALASYSFIQVIGEFGAGLTRSGFTIIASTDVLFTFAGVFLVVGAITLFRRLDNKFAIYGSVMLIAAVLASISLQATQGTYFDLVSQPLILFFTTVFSLLVPCSVLYMAAHPITTHWLAQAGRRPL